MTQTLEDAVAALVADAKAHDRLLRVAPAAVELAREFPEASPQTIAQMIIDAGAKAHVNLAMSMPEEGGSGDEERGEA